MSTRRPKILGPDGKPYRRTPSPAGNGWQPPRPAARYDAAQTTNDNKRHWLPADNLSAKSANTLSVRKTLRERARYEAQESNSYAKGIVLTLANDLVGTGPRLQILTEDDRANRIVEQRFAAWASAANLAEKLRTMRMAKCVDGEAFAQIVTNAALDDAVKLDFTPIETDQITDPFLQPFGADLFDGVRYDAAGNPTEYYVTDDHPGDMLATWSIAGRWVPAESMIHWFRADRPGQIRGVSELTTALPLFAELRRYMDAVIAAAETAADFSAFMQTDLPPDEEDDSTEVVAMSAIEIRKRMLTTLPNGYKAYQMKPEQPATTLEMFVWVCMRQVARCLNMPLNVALGDSSKSNYASGRLDYQLYRKSTVVEQSTCEGRVLRRIVAAWLREASLIRGYLPPGFDAANALSRWFWDGWEHVDPQKEGLGDQIDIANRTQSRTEICARRGRDWAEEVLPQLAREETAMREAGLVPAPPQKGTTDGTPTDEPPAE